MQENEIKYNPKHINLDSSIIYNSELNYYLDTVNSDCFRKQINYKRFLCTILLKQYYYHLKRANQSYDLLQMNTGHAESLISDFKTICKLKSRLEMLSSSYITVYLNENPTIVSNEINKYKDSVHFIEKYKRTR